MPDPFPLISTNEILAARPARRTLDETRPYAFFTEPEADASGTVIDVATLFLTNRECPFRCLMCDLWKHTLTETVSLGSIPEQIHFALSELPEASGIKLYNSGNFFDRKAIPAEDYPAIAELVRPFERVIVENHPKLCGPSVIEFRDMIAPAHLEIALGLETAHPELLRSLNKEMTLEDFDRAVRFLHENNIDTRAFLLLNPPFLSPEESMEWTVRSIEYCFERGVSTCSVIATRDGNGIMEQLREKGHFSLPHGDALEQVLERGLAMKRGRVFVDLWEAERFFSCDKCCCPRLQRLNRMNLSQRTEPAFSCEACGT